VDATRGRSRPPPSRRRRRDAIRLPPLSLQSLPPSQLPHHQSTATPAAITTSECATIDATALSRPLSPEALHGQAHLGTVTTASAVDFQGPPGPRRCRSRHPRRRHRPCHHLGRNRRRCRALRRAGGPYGPSAPSPTVIFGGHVTVIYRAHCGVRTSSLVCIGATITMLLFNATSRRVADWSRFRG
jgi:hypothetical protein